MIRPTAAAFLAVILTLSAVAAGPALASRARAFDPYRDDWRIAPEGVQPGLRTADGQPCVKRCPDDRLPCDPPAFKQADGRCSDQWR